MVRGSSGCSRAAGGEIEAGAWLVLVADPAPDDLEFTEELATAGLVAQVGALVAEVSATPAAAPSRR